jgi:hypothetical protein
MSRSQSHNRKRTKEVARHIVKQAVAKVLRLWGGGEQPMLLHTGGRIEPPSRQYIVGERGSELSLPKARTR